MMLHDAAIDLRENIDRSPAVMGMLRKVDHRQISSGRADLERSPRFTTGQLALHNDLPPGARLAGDHPGGD